jgi:hypothetical protein
MPKTGLKRCPGESIWKFFSTSTLHSSRSKRKRGQRSHPFISQTKVLATSSHSMHTHSAPHTYTIVLGDYSLSEDLVDIRKHIEVLAMI